MTRREVKRRFAKFEETRQKVADADFAQMPIQDARCLLETHLRHVSALLAALDTKNGRRCLLISREQVLDAQDLTLEYLGELAA